MSEHLQDALSQQHYPNTSWWLWSSRLTYESQLLICEVGTSVTCLSEETNTSALLWKNADIFGAEWLVRGHTEETWASATSAFFTQLTLLWLLFLLIFCFGKWPLFLPSESHTRADTAQASSGQRQWVRNDGIAPVLQCWATILELLPVCHSSATCKQDQLPWRRLDTTMDTLFLSSRFICELPPRYSTGVLLRGLVSLNSGLYSVDRVYFVTIFCFCLFVF